jgi:outer membrane murein-binding lipoprotein Lpp
MKWLMCMSVVALLGGCDSSKQELDSTKTTLNSVTAERDDLKTKNATLQQQLDAAKAELAKANTPPAATAAVTPAPGKTATDAKHPAAADKSKHHKS